MDIFVLGGFHSILGNQDIGDLFTNNAFASANRVSAGSRSSLLRLSIYMGHH